MKTNDNDVFLGIVHGHYDPAVAIVRNGEVLAYAEEERHIRFKHAPNMYPYRALDYCLKVAGVSLADVQAVAVNWNLPAYTDGSMTQFYADLRQKYPVDERTIAWQNTALRVFDSNTYYQQHIAHWRRVYGELDFPPLYPIPHHRVHALQAAMQSPFAQSIVLTIDGSGDQHCTILWRHEGTAVFPLREIVIPHSLGWVYAAFTEYLGFRAYDGEYKIMGLASYGQADKHLAQKLAQIVYPTEDGIAYQIDPTYIHYGRHTYSDRYTDKLVELFNHSPRLPGETITAWHENLAYAVQAALENAVERLIRWAVQETGYHNVCISGGVGLNVKMNSHIFKMPEVHDIFPHPLCSDAGAAAGAALIAWSDQTNQRLPRLKSLAWGHLEDNDTIEAALKLACLQYEYVEDICSRAAAELAQGHVIGWFQGRMEAGPRALGQRSILADPHMEAVRDKVNGIIKFREYWRPFCPSMCAEAAEMYFDNYTEAPYMTIAFDANDRLRQDAAAVVHVDGTVRVQLVYKDVQPLYHRLLTEFGRLTGRPVLLNTSFNIKGEPIVCTIQDALRTFWSTGLEVLVAGNFLIRKPGLTDD